MIAILSGSLYEVSVFTTRKNLQPDEYVWCNSVDKIRELRMADSVMFVRIGKWYEAAPQLIREFDRVDLQYKRERDMTERG